MARDRVRRLSAAPGSTIDPQRERTPARRSRSSLHARTRGQQTEVVLLLGQQKSIEGVRAIVKRLQSPEDVEKALDATRRWWDRTLGALQVKTPVLSIDLLLNRWLLYQALSCRFWVETRPLYRRAFAFSFRDPSSQGLHGDRLCRSATYPQPDAYGARRGGFTRKATFSTGGIPKRRRGVCERAARTILWLPFTVAQYGRRSLTGDRGILDEQIPFSRRGRLLADGELRRMFIPNVSAGNRLRCWSIANRRWIAALNSAPLLQACL